MLRTGDGFASLSPIRAVLRTFFALRVPPGLSRNDGSFFIVICQHMVPASLEKNAEET